MIDGRLAFSLSGLFEQTDGADGSSTVVPEVTKEALGHAVWDLVVVRLAALA